MADTNPVHDLATAVYWLPQPLMLITASAGANRNVMMAVRGMHHLYAPTPSVVVGMAAHAYTGDLMEQSGEFAVNVLASDQAGLVARAKLVGKLPSNEVDKFREFGVSTFAGTAISAPLIEGCFCNYECKVAQKIETSSEYYLVLGDVVAFHGFPGRKPLIMSRGVASPLAEPANQQA